MNKEIDHIGVDLITCPFCGWKNGDSFEMPDSGIEKCDECNETFAFEREIDVRYYTRKMVGE